MADRFDAVLFDAGGIFVVPDPEVVGPVVEGFGGRVDVPTLLRAHFAGSHALDRVGGEDWLAYHLGYVAAAGVPEVQVEQAAAALLGAIHHLHWRHPLPGAREVLAALVARDVAIGVVSNAGGQIEAELARLGICQVGSGAGVEVRCVVDSHVVGVAKPDPAIFDHALVALGIEASERVAYVGDTLTYDVAAASAAGLTPVLHDAFGFHAADPLPAPAHRVVRGLADVIDLRPGT